MYLQSETVDSDRNAVKIILRNTSLLTLAQLATRVTGLISTLIIARYLGVEGFGIIVSVLASATLFNIINDFGLSTLTIRELGRDHSKLAHNLTYVGSLEVALSALVFVLILLILGHANSLKMSGWIVILLGGKVAIDGFTQYVTSVFQAFEKMEYVLATTVIGGLLQVVCIVIVALAGGDIVTVPMAYLTGSITSILLATVILIRRFGRPARGVDLRAWASYVRSAFPFATYTAFNVIFSNADVALVAIFLGVSSAGLYSAAYRLFAAAQIVAEAFSKSVLPRLSAITQLNDPAQSGGIMFRSLRLLTFLSVPTTMIFVVLGNDLIDLVYGSKFLESGSLFKVLSLGLVPIFVRYALGPSLLAHGREVDRSKIFGISVAIYVALNLLLVPALGPMGAAIANTTFLCIYAAWLYVYSVKWLQLNIDWFIFGWKIVLASFISGSVVLLSQSIWKSSIWLLGIQIVVGGCIYLSALYLLGFFEPNELLAVKRLLPWHIGCDSRS